MPGVLSTQVRILLPPTPSLSNACRAGCIIACVASVSVWFRSKKRPWKGSFGLIAREIKREPKNERGGRGKGGKFPPFLPHLLPALLLVPFFARSLTLVPRSFLLNRTETLATQASYVIIFFILSIFHFGCISNIFLATLVYHFKSGRQTG